MINGVVLKSLNFSGFFQSQQNAESWRFWQEKIAGGHQSSSPQGNGEGERGEK